MAHSKNLKHEIFLDHILSSKLWYIKLACRWSSSAKRLENSVEWNIPHRGQLVQFDKLVILYFEAQGQQSFSIRLDEL